MTMAECPSQSNEAVFVVTQTSPVDALSNLASQDAHQSGFIFTVAVLRASVKTHKYTSLHRQKMFHQFNYHPLINHA
jgi:hypothetical protein